ncbi:helix-turn-helix transcriptional regulator [Rhodohalobacter sp.]|uniref:helix-turn-helix transcriptional regulator n=1 Tax=Rhodohalobacter sp. TaxID=1974210 RepID=UPI002ACE2A55|nr:helix-turn-helix transcriptional regulator [Rhodohalobacter sp.]MDZ7757156.1 helix-turn-helix transcriptional regulator [Rhodohalobacter sp.]
MPDSIAEIMVKYEKLFETGNRRGIEEVTSDKLRELLKRYSGGFGTYSYAVMDFSSGEFLHVAEDIDQIWGYPPESFLEHGIQFLLNFFPEEHRDAHFKISTAGWTYANSLPPEKLLYSTASFDNINRRKNGDLFRILTRQIITRLDGDGKIWLTLAIFTDISHIKKPDIKDEPRLSYYIPKSREFLIYNPATENLINLDILTDRERQVLRQYTDGKTAREIANKLYLSDHTIQTHRANMLKKTGCKNLAELVYFSKYHFLTS